MSRPLSRFAQEMRKSLETSMKGDEQKPFRERFSYEQRIAESYRILQKYPARIPIVIERDARSTDLPVDTKIKFLVPNQMTLGEFMCVFRRRIQLQQSKALFLMVNSKLFPTNYTIQNVYRFEKNSDGFLYIEYHSENTFGE